jgi:hypothetical protein
LTRYEYRNHLRQKNIIQNNFNQLCDA